MKKRERTSYAFLMEMMWVCAFFLICACIFVLAFAKAEQMSRKADTLNHAVLAASNAMEDVYGKFGEIASDQTILEDPDAIRAAIADAAQQIADTYTTDDFIIRIASEYSDGLLTVAIEALESGSGELLYTLNGARAVRTDIASSQAAAVSAHADAASFTTYSVSGRRPL